MCTAYIQNIVELHYELLFMHVQEVIAQIRMRDGNEGINCFPILLGKFKSIYQGSSIDLAGELIDKRRLAGRISDWTPNQMRKEEYIKLMPPSSNTCFFGGFRLVYCSCFVPL
jgi:hypothetical protein